MNIRMLIAGSLWLKVNPIIVLSDLDFDGNVHQDAPWGGPVMISVPGPTDVQYVQGKGGYPRAFVIMFCRGSK